MSATTSSVQLAHQDLHNGGAPVANCPICQSGAADAIHNQKAEEETPMTAEDKVFTEAQHFQLLTSAVERETAELAGAKTELEGQLEALESEKASLATTNTELQNQIDVLESEKAAEATRAETAEKALEDYKAELAELAAIETRKSERTEAIKAADETLADEYFTEARVQRWAEMADDQFGQLVTDLTEAAAAKKPAETTEQTTVTEAARETAAFTGGATATTKGSSLGSFLTATGKLPAAQN